VDNLWLLTAIAACQGAIDSLIFPATQVGAAMAADEELAASAQGVQGATLEVTAGIVAVIAGFLYDPLGPGVLFTGAGVLMLAGAGAAFAMSGPIRRARTPLFYGIEGAAPSPQPAAQTSAT